MISEKIRKMIEQNPIALATIKGNKPYVIAVADVKAVSDSEILIGDNYMKNTKENIKRDNNVCLVVWDNKKGSEAEGYQLIGNAYYYNSGKWLLKVKGIHKGCPAKGAILVKIKQIKKLS